MQNRWNAFPGSACTSSLFGACSGISLKSKRFQETEKLVGDFKLDISLLTHAQRMT
jgi:hypothetical protein